MLDEKTGECMKIVNRFDRHKIITGFYIMFGILLIWIVVFTSHYIIGLDGDHVPQTYALFVNVAKAIHDGNRSFWNPYLWGGFPSAGNFITEAYYPVNWLLCSIFYDADTQLVSYAVIPWNLMIHFGIYYVGMFFLIRKIGFSSLNAFLVGISSVCCFSVFYFRTWVVYLTGFCWIPVIVLLAVSMFEAERHKKAVCAVFLGIVFAMEAFLSVSVMLVFSVFIFAALFAVYQVRRTKKDRMENFIYGSLAGISGILLSFPALLAAVVFMGKMSRFVPDIGFIETGTKIPYEEFVRSKYTFQDFQWMLSFSGEEIGLSVSAVVLVLGLAGMFSRNRKKIRVFLVAAALSVISFFYSFAVFFPRIAYVIPGLNNMREPFMYSVLFGFGWSILAAYGFHALECKIRENQGFGRIFYLKWILAFILVLLLVYNIRTQNADCIFISILFAAGMLLLSGRKKYCRAGFYFISILLVFTEYHNFYQAMDSNTYKVSDAADRLEEVCLDSEKLVSGIQSLDPQDRYYRMASYLGSCYPVNMASILGFYDIQGYVNPITTNAVTLHLEMDFEKRCQLQNVKYILANKNTDPATIAWFEAAYPFAELVGGLQDVIVSFDDLQPNLVSVYRMDCNLGDAWLVQDVQWYARDAEKGEILDRLNDPGFSVQRTALVRERNLDAGEWEELEGMPSVNKAWNIVCTEQNDCTLKYQVTSDVSSVFVAAEAFYPGWKVYVNGERKSLLEIDGTNRGVVIPAGNSQVEFVYRPVGYKLGIVLQLSACVLMVCMLVRQKKRKEEFGL